MFRLNRLNIAMLSIIVACGAIGAAIFYMYKKYQEQQQRLINLEQDHIKFKNTIFAYNMHNTGRGIDYEDSFEDDSEEEIPLKADIDKEAVERNMEDEELEEIDDVYIVEETESEEEGNESGSSEIEDIPENFE